MAKDDEEKEEKGKGGPNKLIMFGPLLLLVVAAGWFFFIRKPADSGQPKALPPPAAGAVVVLDPITINLAGGHFLKLGLTLQPTKAAKEVTGDKALDLAISEFSGKTVTELSTTDGREAAKEVLVARIKLAYMPEGSAGNQAILEAIDKATGKTPATVDSGGRTVSVDDMVGQLSDKQAVAAAQALTVQTQVYDVYLTTFVMQ